MAIALYARKSIEREGSISCDTQLEYCKAMLKPDEGNETLLTFVDNGFSGGNVNRDGFQSMMRQVEQGTISKVIVYRLDRISRSLADFVSILNTFRECCVEFVSTQEAFDTGSPYGELIVKILAVFAEFERQSIIQRVTQAYEHRSEMGFYMGGRKPYGFDLAPMLINNIQTKRLTPIPEEIAQIQFIYATYAVCQMTLGGVLKKLLDNKIKPHSGGAWTTAKLSAIIKNPIYVKADSSVYDFFQSCNANIISPPTAFDGVHGIQIYGKTKHKADDQNWGDIKVVVMTHEGVIDSDTWIQCQQKLSKNKQIRNAVSNQTSWLGGKLICEQCGRTMTTIKGKLGNGEIRRYFSCTGKTHCHDCKGTKSTIYAQSLEDMVYTEIGKKLKPLKNIGTGRRKGLHPEINELRNKIKTIEQAQNKIADLLMRPEAGADLIEIMSQRATKLKDESDRLLLQIDELENTQTEVTAGMNLSKQWKTASFEEKRGVCGVMINHIKINEQGDAEIVWNV